MIRREERLRCFGNALLVFQGPRMYTHLCAYSYLRLSPGDAALRFGACAGLAGYCDAKNVLHANLTLLRYGSIRPRRIKLLSQRILQQDCKYWCFFWNSSILKFLYYLFLYTNIWKQRNVYFKYEIIFYY